MRNPLDHLSIFDVCIVPWHAGPAGPVPWGLMVIGLERERGEKHGWAPVCLISHRAHTPDLDVLETGSVFAESAHLSEAKGETWSCWREEGVVVVGVIFEKSKITPQIYRIWQHIQMRHFLWNYVWFSCTKLLRNMKDLQASRLQSITAHAWARLDLHVCEKQHVAALFSQMMRTIIISLAPFKHAFLNVILSLFLCHDSLAPSAPNSSSPATDSMFQSAAHFSKEPQKDSVSLLLYARKQSMLREALDL